MVVVQPRGCVLGAGVKEYRLVVRREAEHAQVSGLEEERRRLDAPGLHRLAPLEIVLHHRDGSSHVQLAGSEEAQGRVL